MVLSRSDRTHRRRRSMREAVAADSGVAVEHARAKARRRLRETSGDAPRGDVLLRDQGYSQEVRFACQQRLVQLIPVRKRSMTAVFAAMAALWTVLLLLHWAIHVRGSVVATMYIGYFFHIRSPHSLSHWIGCQAWLLTGLVALLIWQLRRHKLDDYRAKYRIWGFLAAAAIFSSFEASTSALYLIGQTIDPWTRREFGYAGGAVVPASFASLVAALGVRLCTELKNSPGSVALWLSGLVSWAFSGVVGSGLFKIDWSPASIDIAVGATWLGGVFAVLLSATLYLRHIYIQAQKRFALRNKWLQERSAWRVPQLSELRPGRIARKLRGRFAGRMASVTTVPSETNRSEQPAKRRSERSDRSREIAAAEKIAASLDAAEDDLVAAVTAGETAQPPTKAGWLRWPRRKHPPQLGEDYSDIGNEHRLRDDGLNSGFEKKSLEQPAHEHIAKPAASAINSRNTKDESTAASTSGRKWIKSIVPGRKAPRPNDGESDESDSKRQETSESLAKAQSRSRWFSRKTQSATAAGSDSAITKRAAAKEQEDTTSESARRGWLRRSDAATKAASKQAKLDAKAAKAAAQQVAKQAKTADKIKTASADRKPVWSRWLDGLTLNPPKGDTAAPAPAKAEPMKGPQMSIPSTSARPPVTANPQQRHPVQDHHDDDQDDGEESGDYRNMSKAERKRLKRQNRAA